MDSACSHPRRNRCADEGIFRLPTPSHLPPPARIRLIKAALESVLKAVWSHDRSLRTSHVPSTLSHSPLARRRLPTSAGEREVSPYQNRGLEPLLPRLPAHVLRRNLPQPSWLSVCFPRHSYPLPLTVATVAFQSLTAPHDRCEQKRPRFDRPASLASRISRSRVSNRTLYSISHCSGVAYRTFHLPPTGISAL